MARVRLRLPRGREHPPLVQVAQRLAVALGLLLLATLVVYVDRGGYRDSAGGPLSFLDALYYATVSLTTTGYGDVVPVTPGARVVTIVVVTPLRIGFLIVLVGTTLLALTERGREDIRIARWRSKVRDHTIICGFGTKGQAAARTLIADGVPKERLLAIDPRAEAMAAAAAMGVPGVQANAERSATYAQAELSRAKAVLVTVHDDNSAVLITLTVRQQHPEVPIAASVREEENVPLLRQSGARSVITSQEAAGRLVGLAALEPAVADLAQDLISYGSGLDLRHRLLTPDEVGRDTRDLDDVVLAVIRKGVREPIPARQAGTLRPGDCVLYVEYPTHRSPEQRADAAEADAAGRDAATAASTAASTASAPGPASGTGPASGPGPEADG